nr:hypothetical protein [Belnapia rosea]
MADMESGTSQPPGDDAAGGSGPVKNIIVMVADGGGWRRYRLRFRYRLAVAIGGDADWHELRCPLSHQQAVPGLSPPLEHQAAVDAMSSRYLCHLHARCIAFGQDAELVRHTPTPTPLAPSDDLDRPAIHDLTADLTPDVKAASLNARQEPGKAMEAGRLRQLCADVGHQLATGAVPKPDTAYSPVDDRDGWGAAVQGVAPVCPLYNLQADVAVRSIICKRT